MIHWCGNLKKLGDKNHGIYPIGIYLKWNSPSLTEGESEEGREKPHIPVCCECKLDRCVFSCVAPPVQLLLFAGGPIIFCSPIISKKNTKTFDSSPVKNTWIKPCRIYMRVHRSRSPCPWIGRHIMCKLGALVPSQLRAGDIGDIAQVWKSQQIFVLSFRLHLLWSYLGVIVGWFLVRRVYVLSYHHLLLWYDSQQPLYNCLKQLYY